MAQQGVLNHDHKYSDGVLRILQVDVNNDRKQDDVLFFPHCYTGSTATSLAMSYGKTYFDFWWDVPPSRVPDPADANVLRVYFPNGSSTRPVCSFRVNSGAQK